MINLFSFGDSWMAGHRGDFYEHFEKTGTLPTHNEKNYGEHETWLKNNTSIPALISKYYNFNNKQNLYIVRSCKNACPL